MYCTVARRSHRNVHNDSPQTCLSQSYQLWLTDRLLFGPSSLDACENVFRSVERLYFRRWKIKKWKLMAMLCKLISSLSPKCSESSYLFNNFIPLKTQGTNSDTVHVNLNAWPQICASYLYYVDIYSLSRSKIVSFFLILDVCTACLAFRASMGAVRALRTATIFGLATSYLLHLYWWPVSWMFNPSRVGDCHFIPK